MKKIVLMLCLLAVSCYLSAAFAMGGTPPKNQEGGKEDSYIGEIIRTVQDVLSGNETAFTKEIHGIKYISKEYELNEKDAYLVLSLVIYKYDPSNHVVRMGMDGLEGWLWERDLTNEIEELKALSPGHYDKEISVESLHAPDFDIKYFGNQKFRYYNAGGRYIYDRIYSTYANNYVFDFAFAVGTDTDNLSDYLKVDGHSKQVVFVNKSLRYINDLEKALNEIRWR